MNRMLLTILCLVSTPALPAWVTDLSKDGITEERVGYTASELDGAAFSVGCVEKAGLQVNFYWTQELARYTNIEIRLDHGGVMSPATSLQSNTNATYLASPRENVELIAGLQRSNKLHVRVLLADGSMSQTVTYDLAGFTASFRSVCQWHPAYQQLAS